MTDPGRHILVNPAPGDRSASVDASDRRHGHGGPRGRSNDRYDHRGRGRDRDRRR